MVRHKGPARGPTMVDRECEFCDKPFQATAYEVKIGKGRFCTKSCSNSSRYERITLTCDHCGSEFQRMLAVYLRRSSDSVFCGRDCYAAARTGDGINRTCKVCGLTKSLSAYWTSGSSGNGTIYYKSTCKECLKHIQQQERFLHPERGREYDRRSYEKHRESVIRRKMRVNDMRRAWKHGALEVVEVNRESIFERDGLACYLCGNEFDRSDLQLDHVVPLSRGGSHTPDNIRVACKWCNSRKGDYLLSELDPESLKPTMKVCLHCGELKAIAEFSTLGSQSWHSNCRPCGASLARQKRSARRNITVMDILNEVYRCNICATEWTPVQEDGIQNIRWYWRCPNGCNHDGKRWGSGERSCNHCGEVKPFNEYPALGSYKCRSCHAALGRQSRAERFRLTILDTIADEYRCNACGEAWIPQIKPGKKHMKGWWHCPNGCNA